MTPEQLIRKTVERIDLTSSLLWENATQHNIHEDAMVLMALHRVQALSAEVKSMIDLVGLEPESAGGEL